jgi:hypothetical protein
MLFWRERVRATRMVGPGHGIPTARHFMLFRHFDLLTFPLREFTSLLARARVSILKKYALLSL